EGQLDRLPCVDRGSVPRHVARESVAPERGRLARWSESVSLSPRRRDAAAPAAGTAALRSGEPRRRAIATATCCAGARASRPLVRERLALAAPARRRRTSGRDGRAPIW